MKHEHENHDEDAQKHSDDMPKMKITHSGDTMTETMNEHLAKKHADEHRG